MFNPQAYENSRPDGFSVLEIINGSKPGKSKPRQFVPLKRTELKGQVIGLLAGLRLIQTFSYTAEQSDKVLEAVYRFPLPGDAAVIGSRSLRGRGNPGGAERTFASRDDVQRSQRARPAGGTPD